MSNESRSEVEAALTNLHEEQFISSWRRDGSRWYINEEPGHLGWGPYGLREIRGFLDGCRAMGVNV